MMMPQGGRLIPLIRVIVKFLLVLIISVSPDPVFLHREIGSAIPADNHPSATDTIPALARSAALQSWRGDIHEKLGWMYFQQKHYPQAIEEFISSSDLRMLSPEGQLALAEACLKSGDFDAAVKTWSTLAGDETTPVNFRAKVISELASFSSSLGDYSSEAKYIQFQLAMEPQNPAAAIRLGYLLSLSDIGSASTYLTLAATLDPSLTAEATSFHSTLQTLDSTDSPAYRSIILGRALGRAGVWELAAAAFENAIKAEPGYAEAHALLGLAREQSGQDGFNELKKAEVINPSSAMILASLSLYWRAHGGTILPWPTSMQPQTSNLRSRAGRSTLAICLPPRGT